MNSTNCYIEKLYQILKAGGYQRTLHYHNTPSFYGKLYEKQLKYIAEHYVSLNLKNLSLKLQRDTFEHPDKKSILIGLFDGYRNNYEVLYPMLGRYGLTAWYLLVSDFLNTPVKEQEKMLEPYHMQYIVGEYEDGRYAMSWEEAREVSRKHVIVNHSSTHYFITSDTDEKRVCYEIDHAHGMIEKNTGTRPIVFSALGGADFYTNPTVSKKLREKGYQYMIGYCLENIAIQDKRDITENVPYEDTVFLDEAQVEQEIRYYQIVMDRVGHYSAVPAILPFYNVDAPNIGAGTQEDKEFAVHFKSIASYLRDRLSFDEWHASHRALDVLAVHMIGENFPYH